VKKLSPKHPARKAVALLFFLTAALPVLWAAGALSTDTMHVINSQRAASQIADTSAIAGATQFSRPGEVGWNGTGLTLNPALAVEVAEQTAAQALESDVGKGISDVEIAASVDTTGPTDIVTVQVSYTVDNLLFIGLAGNFNSDLTVVSGTMSKSASVCIPGQGQTLNGICTRPKS